RLETPLATSPSAQLEHAPFANKLERLLEIEWALTGRERAIRLGDGTRRGSAQTAFRDGSDGTLEIVDAIGVEEVDIDARRAGGASTLDRSGLVKDAVLDCGGT